jgi:hypothetical protein
LLLSGVCGFSAGLRADASANVGAARTGPAALGEPYELGGKRLVFTTWEYVRPGFFAWLNDKGENVSVAGNQGPGEATFRQNESPRGIRIVAQPARRGAPVFRDDRPEVTKGLTITTVLKDGQTYKAWGIWSGQGSGLDYHESPDGRNWKRIAVQFEIDSQPVTSMNLGEGTIFLDPSAPPAERYKCVTLDHFSFEEFERFKLQHPDRWEPLARREDVGSAYFVRGYTSPDGFKWTRVPEPFSVEHSDTQVTGYYDARLGKYVVYTRKWMVGVKSPATQAAGQPWHFVGRRSIGRMESDRFGQFPLSSFVLVPSPEMLPSDTLYTNCRTTIPGAPWFHVMFPTVWHQADDSTSVVMAGSHDGRVWNYLPGGNVLDTAAFGSWDGGCIFARPNLIELADGTFALPYTGYEVPHKYPRGKLKVASGYMEWPRGRIVALEAAGLGEFSLVGLMAPGRTLLINADIMRAGSLNIEVADLGGRPFPGRSFADSDLMMGDQYRVAATWKGQSDLGFPDGSPVLLRFRMNRAKLFALDFE